MKDATNNCCHTGGGGSSSNSRHQATTMASHPKAAITKTNTNTNTTLDIEELHRAAIVNDFSTTYKDPETGFTVFTELAHLKRGFCCGNRCRHCPYGWKNVRSGERRPAVVDESTATARLQQWTDAHTAKTTGGRKGGRWTRKNVPYTRGGDGGRSSLSTGERRWKTDPAFDAMGTVDELCSVIGVVYAQLVASQQEQDNTREQVVSMELLQEWLLDIMSRLFDIGSHLAKPPRRRSHDSDSDDDDESTDGFDAAHTVQLEDWIDVLTDTLPELNSFILPTGTPTAAQLHVARTVCRRAERTVVPLVFDVDNEQSQPQCDPNALHYLNRLSDLLFAAARWVNHQQNGAVEIQYRRPSRGSKQRILTTTTTMTKK